MTIAELFVNIGVKGDGQAKKALEGAKVGIGDISSASLQAKAAVLAVFYAMEQLTKSGTEMGNELWKLGAFTGLDVEWLNKWDTAARSTVGSNARVSDSIMAIQKQLQAVHDNQAAPSKGMLRIGQLLGLDSSRISGAKADVKYFMDKVLEYARSDTDTHQRKTDMLASLGMSPDAITMSMKFKGDVEKIHSDMSRGTVDSMHTMEIQWGKLSRQVQVAFATMNAQHGGEFIKGLQKIIPEVLHLVDAMAKLAEQVKIFTILGKAMENFANALSWLEPVIDAFKESKNYGMGVTQNDKAAMSAIGEGINWMLGKGIKYDKFGQPRIPTQKELHQGKEPTSMNNTFNIHGVDGAEEAVSEMGRAVQVAYRQSASQLRVT